MKSFPLLMRGTQRVAPTSSRAITRLSCVQEQSFTYHQPPRLASPIFARGLSTTLYDSRDDCARERSSLALRIERTCQSRTLHQRIAAAAPAPAPFQPFQTRKSISTGLVSATILEWCIHARKFHVSTRTADEVKRNTGKSKEHQEKPETSSSSSKEDGSSTHEHFYDRLHMPNFHRPTKEELLAAATGFWSRLRVRFKWMTIKSVRPYNMDEIIGFFSWIALGHVVWLIIGTTTFVSLAILAINSIFAQETLARWIGNYLTQSSGLNVVFESAIVPRWRDGVITFKNVFVSRRPGYDQKSRVTKGSPEAAAIAAAAQETIPPEDQNYTQFDITLGEVNVTLSFSKWWNSKGPLQNVEIKHVRGVVDRTHVFWTGEVIDPKSYRHEHNPGDFEIDSFKIEDLLITLHQPSGFRPFPVSIYNADLPRLRKQWLFYDFICANNMTGEYDRSLFTIHPRQTHSFTGVDLGTASDHHDPWKKQSRVRIDALNIDHLNRGIEGPFGWITEGNVDIMADMMIPNDSDDSVMKVMSDFYDQIETQIVQKRHQFQNIVDEVSQDRMNDRSSYSQSGPAFASPARQEEDKRFLIMDLRVNLNDVRASVPIFTKDLSYVNNALIRPIVAYMNSRRTFIPINCRVVKRTTDFDGSWTIFDSGLMDDLSAETYEAFVRDVQDEQARHRRFKKVGLWSLQLAVQAIFLGMAGNIA